MKINNYDIKLNSIIVNWVGNKTKDEGRIIANTSLEITDDLSDILLKYFISTFKFDDLYSFNHNSHLSLNTVYSYISNIFNNPNNLLENTYYLVDYLYENSIHPSIKSGEIYIVYFQDCEIDGKVVDAVGIFKSENKETFLKVRSNDGNFNIEREQGININKLDKGALIFNTDKENGYIVAVVDNTNKGNKAHYWIDEFLHVRQRKDEYYNTQNLMMLTKNFVKNLPEEFDSPTKADIINKTVKFFKEKGSFEMKEFANEVIKQPEIINSFNQFVDNYQKERDIEITDNFTISDTAVKKQVRSLKSVIKLDKNFQIYILGDRDMIENGEDSKGKFYKVYYKEES